MSKAKSKYTAEETIALVTAWGFSTDSGVSTMGITIAELAGQFANKWNNRELIAKLAHEGCYTARPKTKSGKKPIHKDALSTIIGGLCNMAEPDASSLEKSNKGALEKVITTIEDLVKALAFYEAPAEDDDETTDDEKADLEAEQEAELESEESEDALTEDELQGIVDSNTNVDVDSA